MLRPACPAYIRCEAGALFFAWGMRQNVADRVGFEPTVRLHVRLISSQVHSTTLPPVRVLRRGAKTQKYNRFSAKRPSSSSVCQEAYGLWLMPPVGTRGYFVVPEIFISAVICAFHAAKSHSFRTPRLSFKRSPGRLAAKAGQNRRGIVPFARHKKIALRKGTPFLAIMRSSHLML